MEPCKKKQSQTQTIHTCLREALPIAPSSSSAPEVHKDDFQRVGDSADETTEAARLGIL